MHFDESLKGYCFDGYLSIHLHSNWRDGRKNWEISSIFDSF